MSKAEDTPQQQPTPEEITKLMASRLEFMEKQIVFLKVEADYTNLEAVVMENRARVAKATVIMAQIYGERSDKPKQESPSDESSIRTLKKEAAHG